MIARTRCTAASLAAPVLLLCAPAPPVALAQLRATSRAADPTVPLVAAVSLAAWVLTAWLLIAVLLTVLARAPGQVGRFASALARRWAPTAVRRSVELALGLTVATGVLGAGTSHAAAPFPGAAASRVESAPAAAAACDPAAVPPGPLDLDWATSGPASPPPSASAAEPAAPSPAAATLDAGTRAPGDDRPRTAPPAPPAPPPRGARPALVVVRPGDTLWDLSAAALRGAGEPEPSDARIAQAWPRWWAANRDVVGPDPDLILPGMQLTPPVDPAAGS